MFLERENQQTYLTPSDLTTFIGSPWVFAQHLAVARGERARWPDPDKDATALIQKHGEQHEAAYLQKLRTAGKQIAEIGHAKTLDEWAQAELHTRDAIADDGVDVIYQAHLLLSAEQDGGPIWRGQADFLERGANGAWEPVDTKLARSVKPYMIHQLCIYADAIAEITGRLPEQMHIERGDGRRESFRVTDYIDYTRGARQRLEQYLVDGDPEAEFPWPCPTLEMSGLEDEADAIHRERDHLVLVAGIGRKQIEKFEAAGITTISRLAAAGEDDTPRGMARQTFEKLRRQAELQTTSPPTWRFNEPEDGRGFALLPPPDKGDIFYDIEGDPLFDAGGSLEYLHGLWWVDEQTGEEVFKPLWSLDREAERLAFEQLIDFFIGRHIAHPRMHIYHYASYEIAALERLAQTFGTREEELDELLRRGVFIDLFTVVRQGLQASVESYSIKKIEKFYMAEREADLQAGDDSIVLFEQARELEGTDEAKAILQGIADYNEEDCRSTYLLREWLLERRDEAQEQFGWIGEEGPIRRSEDARNASPPTGELTDAQKLRHQQEDAANQLRALAEREPERADELRLLAELQHFESREVKSTYWSMYGHMEMTDAELIEDGEAIGGLEPIEEEWDGKTRRFRFPLQEHRLRAGDSLKDVEGSHAGKVIEIDDVERVATIELSVKCRAAAPSGVFEFNVVSTKPIEEALLELAGSTAENDARFAAAKSLLARTKPLDGDPLADAEVDTLKALMPQLRGRTLVAQGPPGTGKTYTAAELIVDRLAAGERVGITAGTHTAINNLLECVETRANHHGVEFVGAKREAGGTSNTYVSANGLIEVVKEYDDAPLPEADLVAGTAWMFARDEWREQLDWLVIDEAGQFSLARALAVGTAAKGLILVGDPNQLPQVLKGVHPLGAGASTLEHVLGDHVTIPPELGAFLPHTRRLHPELCDFVSKSFYEDRLTPHGDAERPIAMSHGLYFSPVAHTGNKQSSEQEAAAISAELAHVFGAGVPANEVMIVSPYNAQVDLIHSVIERDHPREAQEIKVLTVDKCQGQECEVVFYSLATSGDEEVPRGADFLFSANRFNVAISRARSTAYLVCDPALLASDVHSIAAMRLLNAFVRFANVASGADRG